MPDDTPAPSSPEIGFTMTAVLNQKRQLNASFVVKDGEPGQIASVIDKVLDQFDRAENRYLLKDTKLHMENDERVLKDHIDRVQTLKNAYEREHIAKGRKGDYALQGTQKTNVENLQKTIDDLKERNVRTKQTIAELEASLR